MTNKIACHWLVTRHAGGDDVGPIVITSLLLRCTHAMPPSARSFRVSLPPCLRSDEDVGLAGDVHVAAFSWQSGRHAVAPRRGSSLRMPWPISTPWSTASARCACLSRQSRLGRFMGDAVGMPEDENGHVVRCCRVPMPEGSIMGRGASHTLPVGSYPTMPL